jgi:hypothetical protein
MALVGSGDKAVGWSFGLEFDGVAIKQIQEISGLSIEIDIIDHKHNTDGGKYVQTKLPGARRPARSPSPGASRRTPASRSG